MKKVIEHCIPLQGEKECIRYNEHQKELLETNNFIHAKATEEHVDDLIDEVYRAIDEVGTKGSWNIGDGIEIKIELKYEPGNK